ncbi:MAG TPA: hypothetical protein VG167_10440 [Verrucomicrobiae bacterium]|nr:hypothetical protein [Verrucomicrobiae bacterium]
MNLELAPRFIDEYRRLSTDDQALCDEAIQDLPAAFGYPHQHAGIGVRALRRGVYECRAGLHIRIGFTRHSGTLLLQTVGDHQTIKRWLRRAARGL